MLSEPKGPAAEQAPATMPQIWDTHNKSWGFLWICVKVRGEPATNQRVHPISGPFSQALWFLRAEEEAHLIQTTSFNAYEK